MKAINFVVCLCMAFMLSTFNSLAAGEDFKSEKEISSNKN